jgi:hypothetical protein
MPPKPLVTDLKTKCSLYGSDEKRQQAIVFDQSSAFYEEVASANKIFLSTDRARYLEKTDSNSKEIDLVCVKFILQSYQGRDPIWESRVA